MAVTTRCLGMEGCVERGDFSTCDNGIRAEGDDCAEKVGKPTYACTADLSRELVCRGRRIEVLRACRGPRGCHLEGETVGCDQTLGETDDPCTPLASGSNYACSVDMTTEMVCDGTSHRYRIDRACRGPKHCWIADERVHCDQRLGRDGETCRPPHDRACAEDGSAELECSEAGIWKKARDCSSGCVNRDGHVQCP